MPRITLLALALSLAGCMNVWRALNDEPNPDIAWVAKTGAAVLGCPDKEIKVVSDSEVRGYGWTATGCGKSAACEGRWETWSCVKLPMPWWFDTEDEPLVKVAMKRLALETECPEGSIEALAGAATTWTDGRGRKKTDDVAYRLRACGKAYVCRMASGQTDCKAALDQAPPRSEIPDAGSEIRDAGL